MENKITHLETESKKIYYDALTGIYNRRYFDEELVRTIKKLSRVNGNLCFMMIDIDRFKQYNDTYGHIKGDNCLILVAETISKTVTRTEDFVARYGGEEFVVVLPNVTQAGAHTIAKKMLENILLCKIPHETNDVSDFVTISIGVTVGSVTREHNPEMYIKRADKLLYKAKQDGRNKYVFGKLTK